MKLLYITLSEPPVSRLNCNSQDYISKKKKYIKAIWGPFIHLAVNHPLKKKAVP